MIYLKKEEREPFQESISEVVQMIMNNHATRINKAEFFGFFIDRLIGFYTRVPSTLPKFGSEHFDAKLRKNLEETAKQIVPLMSPDDLLGSMKYLNYVIVTIWNDICGNQASIHSADYGFTSLIHGILQQIINHLDVKDSFDLVPVRRKLAAQGVLADVIFDYYSSKHSVGVSLC